MRRKVRGRSVDLHNAAATGFRAQGCGAESHLSRVPDTARQLGQRGTGGHPRSL